MSAQTFVPGQTVACRSSADYDCIFRFEVVRRTAKFVTLRYFDRELRVSVRTDNQGVEYCLPFGMYSMSPMLYPRDIEAVAS